MSKKLFDDLKTDFKKNINSHTLNDSINVVMNALNTDKPTEQGETVIENTLESFYVQLDKNLSKESDFKKETTEPIEETVIQNSLEQEVFHADFEEYNKSIDIKVNDIRYLSTIYNALNVCVVRIVFVKKTNGKKRIIWATKNRSLIDNIGGNYPDSVKSPQEIKESKEKQLRSKMIKVFDLQANDWRTANLTSLYTDSEQPNISYFDYNHSFWKELAELEKDSHLSERLFEASQEILDGKLIKHGVSLNIPVFEDTTENMESLASTLEPTSEELRETSSNSVAETLVTTSQEEDEMEKIYANNNANKEKEQPQETIEEKEEVILVDRTTIENTITRNYHVILDRLRHGIGYAKFITGESKPREMFFTLNPSIIEAMGKTPKGERTKEQITEAHNNHISNRQLSVFDIGVGDWRRVSYYNLVTCEVPFVTIPMENSIWAECFKSYVEMQDLGKDYLYTNLTLDLDSIAQNKVVESVRELESPMTVEELVSVLLAHRESERTIQEEIKTYIDEIPNTAVEQLRNGIVRATFVKRDGELRTMYCTNNAEIMSSYGYVFENDLGTQIERKMIEVIDINLGEMRKLNLNKLSFKDGAEPFIAIPLDDKLWIELFNKEKTIEEVRNIGGNEEKYIFESNNKFKLPTEDYTIPNIIESSKVEKVETETKLSSKLSHIEMAQVIAMIQKRENTNKVYFNYLDIDFEFALNKLLQLPVQLKENFDGITHSVMDDYYVIIDDNIMIGFKTNGLFAVIKSINQQNNPVIKVIDNNPTKKLNFDLKNKLHVIKAISSLNLPKSEKRILNMVMERLYELNETLVNRYPRYNKKFSTSYLENNMDKLTRLKTVSKVSPLDFTVTDKGYVKIKAPNNILTIGHKTIYVGDRKVFTSTKQTIGQEYKEVLNILSQHNILVALGVASDKRQEFLSDFEKYLIKPLDLRTDITKLK